MPIVKDPVCGRDISTEDLEQTVGSIAAGEPEVDPTKGTKRFHDDQWSTFTTLTAA